MGALMTGRRDSSRTERGEDRIRRYLIEGRLIIDEVSSQRIRAVIRGLKGTHHLGYDDTRGWWCTCQSPNPVCSHVRAVQLVTANPLGRQPEASPTA